MDINVTKDVLGKGKFGKVVKGMINGEDVAVKIVANTLEVENEIRILNRIDQHPNVVTLYAHLHVENHTMLFLTRCTQSLFDKYEARINRNLPCVDTVGGLSSHREQISAGVEHLHAYRVAHLDLKLDNILEQNGCIKIADFDLARSVQADGSICGFTGGTVGFCSPELNSVRMNAFKADSWSLGVCLFVLAFGFLPFESVIPNKDMRFDAVRSNEANEMFKTVSTLLSMYKRSVPSGPEYDAIDRLLTIDTNRRADVSEMRRLEVAPVRPASRKRSSTHFRSQSASIGDAYLRRGPSRRREEGDS